MFRRNKVYSINKQAANEALQNVFAACEQEPNTQSLDALLIKNIANTTLVKTGKWMSIALLILILACPMVFYMAGKESEEKPRKTEISVTSHYLDEENECFENMPEGLQNSERGEAAQEAIDNLESAMNNIEEAIDNLNEAML